MKCITNTEYFAWGGIYTKNVTKYLKDIISIDELLFLQEIETRSLENSEEINEEVNAVVLGAQLVRYADCKLVSRLVAVFHWYSVLLTGFLGCISF